MKTTKCKKCNSDKVIEKLKITDFGNSDIPNNLSVYSKTTDRVLFNNYLTSEIFANVCCDCGKVELYIDNPKELWEAHLKNQEK